MIPRFSLGLYEPGLDRVREEVDRLFAGLESSATEDALTINVFANANEAIVTTEAPGVKLDDLKITLSEDSLTIRCSRTPEAELKGWNYLRRERETGEYIRSIQLPFRVNSDATEARLVKGVLLVRLPRAEDDKPRQIRVKAS